MDKASAGLKGFFCTRSYSFLDISALQHCHRVCHACTQYSSSRAERYLCRWVRSIAFEPGNEWFCTGSGDRTIKIWDLATGQLRLTLTGHIEQVTGLAVSRDHPYMFSCGLDKMVKCWDMEYNKVSQPGSAGLD